MRALLIVSAVAALLGVAAVAQGVDPGFHSKGSNGVEISGQFPDPIETPEETPIGLQFSNFVYESTPPGFPTGYQIEVSDGANYSANGTLITPDLDFNGELDVDVVIQESLKALQRVGTTYNNYYTVKILVTAVNDVPVILDQEDLSVEAGMDLTISLDDLQVEDPDNVFPDDFSLEVIDGPNYTVNGNTITPDQGFTGTLIVQVRVDDGESKALSEIFNLEVEVTESTVIPIITDQVEITILEEEERLITLDDITVDANGTDFPTGFELVVEDGDNYILAIAGGDSIIPDMDFSGVLSVPITVTDGIISSETFNLMVTVTPVNDQPVITSTAIVETLENQPVEITFDALTVMDPDNMFPDDFTLTVLEGENYTVAGAVVTPAQDFNGVLVVPVTVDDGVTKISSEPADVQVRVTAVNSPPVITGQNAVETLEETARTITVNDLIVNDPDNDPGDLSVMVFNGQNYTVENGTTIVPNTDFAGTLVAQVTVDDGTSKTLSNVFDLMVTVTNTNDAPTNIELSNDIVAEFIPVGRIVGQLSTVDPDSADVHSYALVPGDGDDDNASFSISGDMLLTNVIFDVDMQEVFSIRVSSSDGSGETTTKTFIVVAEERDDVLCATIPIAENQLVQFMSDFGIVSDDLDSDGVPEHFTAHLVEFVACPNDGSSIWTATLNAWDANLLAIDAEPEFQQLMAYREALALLMLISESTQATVFNLLNSNGIELESPYVEVECDGNSLTNCMPQTLPGKTIEDGYLVFEDGEKAIDEPYSGSGNFDGDDFTNAEEAANVIEDNGDADDYVLEVTDPEEDGNLGCAAGGAAGSPASAAGDLGMLALIGCALALFSRKRTKVAARQ